MENYLERVYLDKKFKGQKTYNGHASKEDDIIIKNSINFCRGNTYPSDDYEQTFTYNK